MPAAVALLGQMSSKSLQRPSTSREWNGSLWLKATPAARDTEDTELSDMSAHQPREGRSAWRMPPACPQKFLGASSRNRASQSMTVPQTRMAPKSRHIARCRNRHFANAKMPVTIMALIAIPAKESTLVHGHRSSIGHEVCFRIGQGALGGV